MEQNKQSVKDLLEALEQAEKNPDAAVAAFETQDSSIMDFLNRFNLNAGSHKVPIPLLYKFYQIITKEVKTKRLFYSTVKSVYKVDRRTNSCYISLSYEEIETLYRGLAVSKNVKPHGRALPTKQFEGFLASKNILVGDNWVEVDYLYNIYAFYRKKSKAVALSKDKFTRLLKLYFEYRTKLNAYWVRIDLDKLSHNLSVYKTFRENYFKNLKRVIRGVRRTLNYAAKEKKPTLKAKVPRTKRKV